MQNTTIQGQFLAQILPLGTYLLFALILLIPASPTSASFWIFVLTMIFTVKHGSITHAYDTYQLVMVLLLLLVFTIGIAFSSNPATSAKASLKSLAGFLAIYGVAKYTTFYPLQQFTTFKNLLIFVTGLVIAAMFASYYACYWSPSNCGIENITNVQNKWVTVILILVCGYCAIWSSKWHWVYFLISGSLLFIAWVVEGKGAAIAGLLVLLISLILMIQCQMKRLQALLLSILFSMMLFFYWYVTHPKYFTLDTINTLIQGRIELWSAALVIIQEHPWAGIGIGTWRSNIEVNDLMNIYSDEISPHNVLLELISSLGIFASIAFTGFVLAFILTIQKLPLMISKEYRRFGLLILLAIVTNGMIDFRLFGPQFIAISGIGLVLWRGGQSVEN